MARVPAGFDFVIHGVFAAPSILEKKTFFTTVQPNILAFYVFVNFVMLMCCII